MSRIVGEVGDRARRRDAAEGRGSLGRAFHRSASGVARGAPSSVGKPILVHAILETAEGVNNVNAIAAASPRLHGMSLGPADLAASRAMKTTRVGGGHPDYRVLGDPGVAGVGAAERPAGPLALHDRANGRRLRRPRDQAVLRAIRRFFRSRGLRIAVPQRLPAGLRGGLDAASRARSPLPRKCSPPIPSEVAFARKILAAMPDGSGAVMIDGKMQDDATWKQARVIVDLARQVARKDPEFAALYAFDDAALN